MERIKILHTGDLHLGASFAHSRLPGRIGRIRRQELWETFSSIIETVKREKVQILLIAGDLLEYNYCNPADVRRIDSKFGEIRDVHVCISPGNHDPVVADALYNTYRWSPNVHIFREERFEKVRFDHMGTVVWGMGWNRSEIKDPLLEGFRADDEGMINILLLHCDVVTRGRSSPYLPVYPEQLAGCGVDYSALGHIHKNGEISFGGRVVGRYCGSPEPLDFGETGCHGVYIGEVGRDVCRVEFRSMAKRNFISSTIKVDPYTTIDEITGAIGQKIASEGEHNLYRFELAGILERGVEPDTGSMEEKGGAFYIEVEDNTRPDYDLEAMAESRETGVRSRFVARILHRLEKETDPERKAVLERALYMGLDALDGRKVIVK